MTSINWKINLPLAEKHMHFYLGRVALIGTAATAGILQLISGLISKIISLLISTV